MSFIVALLVAFRMHQSANSKNSLIDILGFGPDIEKKVRLRPKSNIYSLTCLVGYLAAALVLNIVVESYLLEVVLC